MIVLLYTILWITATFQISRDLKHSTHHQTTVKVKRNPQSAIWVIRLTFDFTCVIQMNEWLHPAFRKDGRHLYLNCEIFFFFFYYYYCFFMTLFRYSPVAFSLKVRCPKQNKKRNLFSLIYFLLIYPFISLWKKAEIHRFDIF